MVPKTAPKQSRKRSTIETNNRDEEKAIQDDLGPVLGRVGPQNRDLARVVLVFLKHNVFDVKTVRRRSWDQLWPTKAPKRPKMTHKTEPKSTPRRSKIDVKIVIKNDAKTKRAWHVLGRRHRAGTPPSDPLGGAPGTRGGGPGPMGPLKSQR